MSLYEGQSVTFSIVAEGNPTLKYQWTKNTSPLSGKTTSSLSLNNLLAGDSGTYAVIVTHSFGMIKSSVPLTVLQSPPLITTQPQPASRFEGAKFTFKVKAVGSSPIFYQWSLAGSPIAGATASAYTNTASSGIAGNYSCSLSNQLSGGTP